jgi:hypothetical protein
MMARSGCNRPSPRNGVSLTLTVKQHMAAIRMLFSWLTEKGVLAMNPAREVKTERFSRTEGKTPAFVEGEVQQLLDVIETSTHTGLRDRALLGTLAYTFARIGAVVNLKVQDYYPSGKRLLSFFSNTRLSPAARRAKASWRPTSNVTPGRCRRTIASEPFSFGRRVESEICQCRTGDRLLVTRTRCSELPHPFGGGYRRLSRLSAVLEPPPSTLSRIPAASSDLATF